MFRSIKKFDHWLDSHIIVWFLLIVMAVLRIPNFFEPYWYGDEGIYLTIGNALKQGGILYQTIVDHKTPLIYYLAMVPSLPAFRVILFLFASVSVVGLYILSFRFLKSFLSRAIAGIGFVLLTTLPLFEGHIANGELFVIGFVLLGWMLIAQTPIAKLLSKDKSLPLTELAQLSKQSLLYQAGLFFLAGLAFGLGILTKVPALFDAVAVALLFWWFFLRQLDSSSKKVSFWWQQLKFLLPSALLFGIGLLLPLGVSILYFTARGAFPDYLQFGLLYNFHYASNWGLPFSQPWLVWLFTLPGKAAVVGVILIILSIFNRKFSPAFLFSSGWFLLALFASLLSNRPYPHYYLQLIPPLVLLVGVVVDSLRHVLKRYHLLQSYRDLLASILLLALLLAVLRLLQVGGYSVSAYYSSFYRLITKQITATEYRNSFNHLMNDNYEAAELLSTVENNRLFIWGTNPSLYALTKTVPVGKFTVAFHIQDLGVYEETLAAVQTEMPEYIVVMNDDANTFPELTSWIKQKYIPNTSFEHFVVWRKQELQP